MESLILDDVANHVVQAVKNVELKVVTDSSLLSTTLFACGSDDKWEYGALVQHEILNVSDSKKLLIIAKYCWVIVDAFYIEKVLLLYF